MTHRSAPPTGLLCQIIACMRMDNGYQQPVGSSSEMLGKAVLLAYAFLWLLSIRFSQYAEGLLMAITLYRFFRDESMNLRRDPLFWLVIGWACYQVAFLPWVVREYPEIMEEQLGYAQHYAKVALIPVVAWWLRGSTRMVTLMLILAVTGFFIGVTFQTGGFIDSVDAIRQHQRVGLGYRNWEHTAVYASFALIVFLSFSDRIMGFLGRWRFLGYVCVIIGVVYSVMIILVVQTRATWIGLLAAAMVAILLKLATGKVEGWKWANRRTASLGISIITILAILAASLNIPALVKERLAEEQDVFSLIAKGSFEQVPLTNVGIRVVTWVEGVEWFRERPLFGWGPKTRQVLIQKGNLPAVITKEGVHHFHNQYLELAIAYGLVGVIFFAAVVWVIGKRGWDAWRIGGMPEEVMLFGLSFIVYWLVVNLVESYLNYTTGTYINALVAGAFYSYTFRDDRG